MATEEPMLTLVTGEGSVALAACNLSFAYPGHAPLVRELSLQLPRGSRCLLCGANGGGKSTLLQVFGGKTMVDRDAVRVLGLPPFHTTDLVCSGQLSYLGSQWRRSVACVGSVEVGGDIPAGDMIFGVAGVDPTRRAELISLLGVDVNWSMSRVSDGQRRRVQICLGLLKPFQVLLCDEVTVDLDVCARVDLLAFLRRETEQRGATVVFATHIFDGLTGWPSHVAYVERGMLKRWGSAAEVPEMCADGDADDGKSRLLSTMEKWLRAERDDRLTNARAAPGAKLSTPFAFSSRQMSHYR